MRCPDRPPLRPHRPAWSSSNVACFHSLRHTFTTIVARQTKDARLAQRMADHADITTTQGYLHTEQTEHAAVMQDFPTLRATKRATGMVQTSLLVSNDDRSGRGESCTQVSATEALRPDVSEPVVRSLVMEPGGIEPPSRDSQQSASTRVVTGLISTAGRAATPFLWSSLGDFLLRRAETPLWSQPDVFQTPPYRALGGIRRSLIRLRGHNCACCQLLCVRAFYEASTPLDARRQAFPVRSIPIGPGCERAGHSTSP